MKILNLEHLVLTVADISQTIKFYTEVLGMEELTFDANRKALKFGNQKINLHQKGQDFEPKAEQVIPGSADLCFITTSDIQKVKSDIENYGIRILEGIVPRTGVNGKIYSIYFRDPEGNLIEVSNYDLTDREIDKLAYIDLQDGKILSTRSKGKDKYYIPGGKRDPGENDIEALQREVEEELSVKIIPTSARYIGTFKAQAHGHTKGVMVKMTCYSAAYDGVLKPDSEIEEIRWLNYKDMDLISHVDKVIFEFLYKRKELK